MNSHRSKDLTELKKQAVNFYATNTDVTKRIEEALNSLFYESPYDIYGYLSDFFVRFSKPAILTKIEANKVLIYDPKGQPTFSLNTFCQERNKEEKIIQIDGICFSPDIINDSSRIQHIEYDDNNRIQKLNDVIDFINLEANREIRHFSPFNQNELDDRLMNFYQNKQKEFYGKYLLSINVDNVSLPPETVEGKNSKSPSKAKSESTRKQSQLTALFQSNNDELQLHFNTNHYALFTLSLLSKSICLASSVLSKLQPFERVIQISQNKFDKLRMPIPMISLIQHGKGFNGKLNLIKEIIVMAKPNKSIHESAEIISKLNRCLRDNLYQSKTQPGAINRCVTENGSFTTQLDAPQPDSRYSRVKLETLTRTFSRQKKEIGKLEHFL